MLILRIDVDILEGRGSVKSEVTDLKTLGLKK